MNRNGPPRWVNLTILVGTLLLMAVAGITYSTMQTTQRTEQLANQQVTELRSLNQFWRDLVAEQRRRNDSLRARADSLRQNQ